MVKDFYVQHRRRTQPRNWCVPVGRTIKKLIYPAYKTLTDAHIALALVKVFPVPGLPLHKVSKQASVPKTQRGRLLVIL